MKKCTLCDTLVLGDVCPNCGMRMTENINDSKEREVGNKYKTNKTEYKNPTNKGFSSYNNTQPKKIKLPRSVISIILLVVTMNATEILDLFGAGNSQEPVMPEYDYAQIAENLEDYNDSYKEEAAQQNQFASILDDVELPDIEGFDSLEDTVYWQAEYDFLKEQEASAEFYQEFSAGTHLGGLDVPAGDYILKTNPYNEVKPDEIIFNGENLEVTSDMFLTFKDGDILQVLGGTGFSLTSPNHQTLTFLEPVAKNDDANYYTIIDTAVVGDAILANTYDVYNWSMDNDVTIKVDYPDTFVLRDFEVILTVDDYFFDNLLLPEGTVVTTSGEIDIESSPFDVLSVIN